MATQFDFRMLMPCLRLPQVPESGESCEARHGRFRPKIYNLWLMSKAPERTKAGTISLKAVGAMPGLKPLGTALLQVPLPNETGIYRPNFRLYTTRSAVVHHPPGCPTLHVLFDECAKNVESYSRKLPCQPGKLAFYRSQLLARTLSRILEHDSVIILVKNPFVEFLD